MRGRVLVSCLVGGSLAAIVAACGGSGGGSGFSNPGTTPATIDASSIFDNGTNVGSSPILSLTPTDGGTAGAATSGGVDASCAGSTAKAARAPAYLQIILDGSETMGDLNKWPTATSALTSIFTSVEASGDTTLGMGLSVFSDSTDPCKQTSEFGNGPTCSYPTSKDILLRAVDSTQLTKLTGRMSGSPFGNTPTSSVLKGNYAWFDGFTASAPLPTTGKKVIVLITDGLPTDNSNDSLSEAAAAAAGGIPTFVVGVGPFGRPTDDYDPTFLGALATSGGTALAGCNPSETKDVTKACYFQITPDASKDYTQDFINAIDAIRGEIASCTYQLDFADAGTVDPSQINVVYTDGTGAEHTLLQDPTNGWTYDNPTSPTEVILHGTDCSAVKSDPNGTVDIVVGCTTQVAPTPPVR